MHLNFKANYKICFIIFLISVLIFGCLKKDPDYEATLQWEEECHKRLKGDKLFRFKASQEIPVELLKKIKLRKIGPKSFQIRDIQDQLYNGTNEKQITKQIKQSGEYKIFTNEEVSVLKEMGLSDTVIIAMINSTLRIDPKNGSIVKAESDHYPDLYLSYMLTGDLSKLLNNWLDKPLDDCCNLYNIRLFWWARISKIIAFLTIITIIADLIGPVRLRKFGNSLHLKIAIKDLISIIQNVIKWFNIIVQHPVLTEVDKDLKAYEQKNKLGLIFHIIYFALLLCFCIFMVFFYDKSWFIKFILLILSPGLVVVPAAGISFVLIVASMIFAIIADILILEPMAWILDRPHVDIIIKIWGIIILIIAFFFDMLSS